MLCPYLLGISVGRVGHWNGPVTLHSSRVSYRLNNTTSAYG